MKIYLPLNFLVLSTLFCTESPAQVSLESASSGTTRDGAIIVYGSDGLVNRIPYTKIRGSAFWNDEWNLATLFTHQGKLFDNYQAKLNLATHELHFINKKGEELAASRELIERIVFYNGTDTSQVLGIFRNDFTEINYKNKGVLKYVQVMNQGKAELLKITNKMVKSADSLFGTMKRYYFIMEQKYFLHLNQKTEPIKKMNKENIFSFLPAAHQYEPWFKENKIQFSKEEDVIKFLNYYNRQQKTE